MPIPEHVKAEADKAVAETGAQKLQVKDMGAVNAAADWKDTAAMESAREQQRQNALQAKAPDLGQQPDKS